MYVGDDGRVEILRIKSDDTFLVKFSDLPCSRAARAAE